MEDSEKKRDPLTAEKSRGEQIKEEPSYSSSIEKMSEKWRLLKRQGNPQDERGFFERNFLIVGLFIALLLLALTIVIGGFAFLVWNAP
jgi:hypothetical protein